MSTLAQVTKETRIFLKIGAAAAILALVVFFIFKGGGIIKNMFFPTPIAPPDQKFGVMENIVFPKSLDELPIFSINTVSGTLPPFPDRIKVYSLKKNSVSITALNNAKSRLAGLNYTGNQQFISTSVYKWTQTGKNNVLTYNINSFNFSVESDFATNPLYISSRISSQSQDDVQKKVADFIDALGADRSDIDIKNAKITYLNIVNTNLTPTEATPAQIERLDIFQTPVDQLAIYYPLFEKSLLNFMVANNGIEYEVVAANYNHFSPDLTSFGTYPLKTSSQAYLDLQNGKGFIVSPTPGKDVEITDVSLGYYLNEDEEQKYLLPIVVFRGKNNFLAYVDALAH